ncbi:MAG: DUF2231 domain-containing protein [Bacteroidetes bacterium]|nr:DUF2231 domain-containing protein [Bacteroidota bacterium]
MFFEAAHIHAMLIHFPVALLLVGFVAELAGFFYKTIFFREAAFYLLVLGTLAALLSYFSGRAAGSGMEEGALSRAMELHEQAARSALGLAVSTSWVYGVFHFLGYHKTGPRIMALILFAGLVAMIAVTGYLGGQLVFRHGAGVELALPGLLDPGGG